MKIKKYTIGILTASLIATSSVSCSDSFESINTDPNETPMGMLNPYGVFEAMFYGYVNRSLAFTRQYNNELVQFTACTGSNGNDIHRYSINNSNVSTIWTYYARYAANADHMVQLGITKNEPAAQAVGLTLKVLIMSNLTDLFGDVPYREAFQHDQDNWTPAFDSQKDVYEQMFADLEAANNLYAKSPVFAKPSIDLMYGGNMTLWQKFNNSLYLRLLMRVSGRTEMGADTKIAEIVSNSSKYPIISSESESATVKYTGIDPYFNNFRPSNTTETQVKANKIAKTLLNLMLLTGRDSEEDPRLTTMAIQRAGDWKGVQGGCAISDARLEDDGASYPNYAVLVRDAAHAWILDYSEVQFILAEAALKGYITGGESTARTHYENAVTASCRKWGQLTQYSSEKYQITDERIADLLAGKLAGWDENSDHDILIANQKFISLFWIGFEAYHELRRTGYPVITIGNGCSYNNFEYPQRLYYPTNTVGSNSTNVQIALDRMGGENNLHTSVWWSYKAINGTFTAVRQQK